MNILSVILIFQLSLASGGMQSYEPPDKNIIETYDVTLFTEMGIGFVIKDTIFVKGSMEVGMAPHVDNIFFIPLVLSSYFNTGIRYSDFEIGWEHICVHPVTPNFEAYSFNQFVDLTENRVYFRYSKGWN